MKKAIILLADGFEQSEALVTHDILLRSKQIDVKLVTINKSKEVLASSGLKIEADLTLSELNNVDEYDFLVLPGGMPGVKNLYSSYFAMELIKTFIKNKRHVHAICAAPFILGSIGYLDDKSYTCFPSFETGKGRHLQEGVVVDKNTVTGKAMGYSTEFGLNIVRLEINEDTANGVKKSILGE